MSTYVNTFSNDKKHQHLITAKWHVFITICLLTLEFVQMSISIVNYGLFEFHFTFVAAQSNSTGLCTALWTSWVWGLEIIWTCSVKCGYRNQCSHIYWCSQNLVNECCLLQSTENISREASAYVWYKVLTNIVVYNRTSFCSY